MRAALRPKNKCVRADERERRKIFAFYCVGGDDYHSSPLVCDSVFSQTVREEATMYDTSAKDPADWFRRTVLVPPGVPTALFEAVPGRRWAIGTLIASTQIGGSYILTVTDSSGDVLKWIGDMRTPLFQRFSPPILCAEGSAITLTRTGNAGDFAVFATAGRIGT